MALRSIKKTNVRNRAAGDPSVPASVTPAIVDDIEATAADTIRVTFRGPVFRNKVPKFKAGADGAETVASMMQVTETQWDIVFTGEVQGTNLLVKEGDPGMRTVPGGFVPAGTYPIPTFP